MDERRAHARHEHVLEVKVTRDGQGVAASTIDLSAGGVRLSLDDGSAAVGQKLALAFSLPELDHAVEVQAQVRWVDRIDPRICGVQFLEGLRAKEVWAINRLNE